MKKVSLKFLLLTGLMVSIFFACGDDDDGPDFAPPVVTGGDDQQGEAGETVTLTFGVVTPGGYERATPTLDLADLGTATITDEPEVGDAEGDVVVSVEISEDAEAGTSAEVTLNVQDQQNQEAEGDARVSVVAGDDPEEPEEPEEPALPTAEAALDTAENLTRLNAAVDALELNETLNSAEEITIFAPRDAAFDSLIAAVGVADLTALLDSLGNEAVSNILQAHIVGESLRATDVVALAGDDSLTTLNGEMLGITTEGDDVFVNGAQIVKPDILISNGVIHVIDSVINLPEMEDEGDGEGEQPGAATVVDVITAQDDALSSLEAAVTRAELADDLRTDGPFTVFAPNNTAFQTLLDDLGEDVNSLEDIDVATLANILQAHVVPDELLEDKIIDEAVYQTLQGATLTVTQTADGGFQVNGANIVETNLVAGNGVVHIIDQVVNRNATSTASSFTVTITNESTERRFFQHGVFNTPVGADAEAAIGPGEAYAFSFYAGPNILPGDNGTRLSFAAMLMGSQDQFVASIPNGIDLYDDANAPITGTFEGTGLDELVKLYDAGTKDDEGTDIDTPGAVQDVGSVSDLVSLTVSYEDIAAGDEEQKPGPLFTVRITNVSTDRTISPGVYGVHTEETPVFSTNRGVGDDGLELLAEEGDPSALANTFDNNDGFAVPLSAGVYVVHNEGVTPILTTTTPQPASDGLELLAEEGNPTTLATALAQDVTNNENIKASGTFGQSGETIGPEETFSFTIENPAAGDYLSLATMMVQSNDIIYATPEAGISLFLPNGNPRSGTVENNLIVAYDVGTEVNEYPGAGLSQPIRSDDGVGTAEDGNVTRIITNNEEQADGFSYFPVQLRMRVTITPNP